VSSRPTWSLEVPCLSHPLEGYGRYSGLVLPNMVAAYSWPSTAEPRQHVERRTDRILERQDDPSPNGGLTRTGERSLRGGVTRRGVLFKKRSFKAMRYLRGRT